MTREINFIVVHHTVSASATVDSIRAYHVGNKGWDDIGYHAVVHRDGTLHAGRSESTRGAHTANPAREGTEVGELTRSLMPDEDNSGNAASLGIVVCGNMNNLTPTHDQINCVVDQCVTWCSNYEIDPAHIFGHRDFQTHKTCPGSNMYERLPEIRRAVARRISAAAAA